MPRGVPQQSGISWNDPDLAIEWPIRNPIVSERDQSLMSFKYFLKQYSHIDYYYPYSFLLFP